MSEKQNSPVSIQERIGSIDVLRGVAILGILLMNSITFSMVLGTYENPSVYNDLSGADWWTWLTLHCFADQKFMTIFSILFGAGVCIFTERVEAKSNNVWSLQLSRMGWLLLIGLIHAYFIWYGDILVSYAVAGVAIALVRKWRPRTLFIVGCVSCFGVILSINAFLAWSLQYWPEVVIQEMRASRDLASDGNVAEIAAYTGSWAGQFWHRVPTAFSMHVFLLPVYIIWRVAGLMMIGMAAYKWGILSAMRSLTFYGWMVGIGLIVGLPLIGVGVWQKSIHGWDPVRMFMIDGNWNLVGAIFVAGAWIGLVMLMCKLQWLPLLRKALASVGRMALTNYIGQSLICTLLFYGHGLGWFGQFERVELLGVVACIWIFQIIFSLIWLRYFRFGPLEWAWRCATYMKLQPMLLSSGK